MSDWNTPTLSSTYTDVLTNLKDRDVDVLKMLDGVTSTNLPSGAKRYNSINSTFEKWNGSAWSGLSFRVSLPNNVAIQSSNAAGSATIDILKVNAIDQTVLSSAKEMLLTVGTASTPLTWALDLNGALFPATALNLGRSDLPLAAVITNSLTSGSGSDLYVGPVDARYFFLRTNNAIRWVVDPAGAFRPNGNDSLDLGYPYGSGARILSGYIRDLPETDLVQSSATLTIGTIGTYPLHLKSNNSVRWVVDYLGHFVPTLNQGFNIGIPTSNAVGSVYAVSYPGPSDKRIKTNVAAIENKRGLESVLKLNPVTYRYTDLFDKDAEESRKGKRRAGFHAQEVYDVIPEAVIHGDDNPDRTLGDEGFAGWSLDPQHILPYVVAAIKELNHKIDKALF